MLPETDGNSARRPKVRSTLVAAGESDHFEAASVAKSGSDGSPKMAASDKLILEKLETLAKAQSETANQIQNLTSVLTQKLDFAISAQKSNARYTCNYCKKAGHIAWYCRKRKADEEAQQKEVSTVIQGNSSPLP